MLLYMIIKFKVLKTLISARVSKVVASSECVVDDVVDVVC